MVFVSNQSRKSIIDPLISVKPPIDRSTYRFCHPDRMMDGIRNLEAKFKELKAKRQLMKQQRKRDANAEG